MTALSVHELDVTAAIVESIYDNTLNAIRNRFGSMGLPSFPSAELLGFWGGAQLGAPIWVHNPRDYATDIEIPVLMLHGIDDPRATLEQAQRVYSALAGRKRFVEFPVAGHLALWDREPSIWNEEIARFLDSIEIASDVN